MLDENSPFESYGSTEDFPATGTADVFYLDGSSVLPDENIPDQNSETDPPASGDIYLWIGNAYDLYCTIQDTEFVGPRPPHPPHVNA